jgi:hypothetical protein
MDENWPPPWRFEWTTGRPVVLAANGRVVCVLPTGTLKGPFETEDVAALGEWIAALSVPKRGEEDNV